MGSKELYDFVGNNPEVELYPIDYVNDRRLIAGTTGWSLSTPPSRSISPDKYALIPSVIRFTAA